MFLQTKLASARIAFLTLLLKTCQQLIVAGTQQRAAFWLEMVGMRLLLNIIQIHLIFEQKNTSMLNHG